jgi:hypothetical protein
MSFFQNVFDFEFRGTLFGADRKYQTTYKVPANVNRSDYIVSSLPGPYNLTGNVNLTLQYAYDPDLRNYASLTIDVSGATASETKVGEIVAKLNSNSVFSSYFVAQNQENKVLIKASKAKVCFRSYVVNSSAETIIKFNKNAPVVELPAFFERYSIENRFAHPELGPNRLILLDPADPVHANVITAAGLDPLTPKADWELLRGSNDAFWFYKRIYSGNKLSSEIKYQAGAAEGDLAKRTDYVYDGSDLIGITEIPYILQSSDLITPPT